jgi:AraC family transcriptional regulator
MWNRYGEPLSLTEIADTAILSKFHFSRVFGGLTGTSPGRFLAAVRMFKAKNLLLETSQSVTDISLKVGYNSLGTFTSRFTKSVGVCPTEYRVLSQTGIPPLLPSAPTGLRPRIGSVCGTVTVPQTDTPVRVYVGAFNSPVVEGRPVSCNTLESSGAYYLDGLPDGMWYIRAMAVAVRDVDPRPWIRRPVYIGACRPVTVRGAHTVLPDIRMQPGTSLDLPILLALPELDSRCLPAWTETGQCDRPLP